MPVSRVAMETDVRAVEPGHLCWVGFGFLEIKSRGTPSRRMKPDLGAVLGSHLCRDSGVIKVIRVMKDVFFQLLFDNAK